MLILTHAATRRKSKLYPTIDGRHGFLALTGSSGSCFPSNWAFSGRDYLLGVPLVSLASKQGTEVLETIQHLI